MSNEVMKPEPEIDPFKKHAQETSSRSNIVGHLLRFTKHGDYKAGQNQDEVVEGTRMLAYMPSLKKGWVKWKDGQPVQHVIGLVIEGYEPPPRDTLGDMDESEWSELNGRPIDPWQNTNYLVMCDEEGQLYTFVTSSKGGLSAIGELSDAYADRRRMKPDEIPIVELHSRSYQHKDYGETFAPALKITGWAKTPDDFKDVTAALADGSDAIEDETQDFPVKMKTLPKAPPPTVKAKPAPTRVSSKTPPPKSAKNGARKGVRF